MQGFFGPGSKGEAAAVANQGVVSNGTIISRAGVPPLPILNIQSQEEAFFQFDPLGAGKEGAGLKVGDLAIGNLQESQDVRTQAAGLPMLGPFGVVPESVQRVIRVCPTGHRLALDGLCYPKALLAKRSKLRMWPAEPAPPITRADGRALRGHERVEKKLKVLGKRAGLKVTG